MKMGFSSRHFFLSILPIHAYGRLDIPRGRQEDCKVAFFEPPSSPRSRRDWYSNSQILNFFLLLILGALSVLGGFLLALGISVFVISL